MAAIETIALAAWGFLVGFLGWAALPRLAEPIVDQLFRFRGDATKLKGVAMFLVVAFLMTSVLLMISLMPMFLLVAHDRVSGHHAKSWRDMFGVAFMSSLAGLIVHGLFRKFGSIDD